MVTARPLTTPSYAFAPPRVVSVPIVGRPERFPVHRIYCVGRNYAAHAREMGFTGREPPFFFLKPADAALVVEADSTGAMSYPPLSANLHHEIELVAAIGVGGRDIPAQEAARHLFGYAVGLDMTRRDLQEEMKKLGRPWCIGKAFEQSAPIAAITPAAAVPQIEQATIELEVNGKRRQHSTIGNLIWSISEIVEQLSKAWELQPGDLIYTGTPEGVAAVGRGDLLRGSITGLTPLSVRVT